MRRIIIMIFAMIATMLSFNQKANAQKQVKVRLTRKTLCLPKDHRQSIEKEVKIYNPSELSSKLLYL